MDDYHALYCGLREKKMKNGAVNAPECMKVVY